MPRTPNFTVTEINEALVQSCINNQPIHFIPYLLSKNVIVESENKVRFYKFFKYLLNCAHSNSVGPLELKIEKYPWEKDNDMRYYNFYDEVHKYDRLSFKHKEIGNKVFIETMPF